MLQSTIDLLIKAGAQMIESVYSSDDLLTSYNVTFYVLPDEEMSEVIDRLTDCIEKCPGIRTYNETGNGDGVYCCNRLSDWTNPRRFIYTVYPINPQHKVTPVPLAEKPRKH